MIQMPKQVIFFKQWQRTSGFAGNGSAANLIQKSFHTSSDIVILSWPLPETLLYAAFLE